MRKMLTIEVIIIISVLAIVLPLAFSSHSALVTKYNQAINRNNASRAITFDLKTGQIVSGSLTYSGDTSGTWFTIYDPDGNPMVASPTDYEYEDKTVIFSFTANIDGEYYARLPDQNPFGDHIDYSYSVSPPPILDFDRTVLIGIVITIGVVSALVAALLNRRLSKTTICKT